MSNGDVVNKYVIPLNTCGDADTVPYNFTTSGEVLVNRFHANHLVIVQTGSIPHFHKDNVGVQVEEVNKSDYTE